MRTPAPSASLSALRSHRPIQWSGGGCAGRADVTVGDLLQSPVCVVRHERLRHSVLAPSWTKMPLVRSGRTNALLVREFASGGAVRSRFPHIRSQLDERHVRPGWLDERRSRPAGWTKGALVRGSVGGWAYGRLRRRLPEAHPGPAERPAQPGPGRE